MTPKGHAIPSKTQLLSYGTPAFRRADFFTFTLDSSRLGVVSSKQLAITNHEKMGGAPLFFDN